MKSGIVWLASYPKSGNTWLRVFLTNLLSGGDRPADINRLAFERLAANRRDFDQILSLESSDMTPDEVERCRPAVYRRTAASARSTLYVKTHDAFTRTSTGELLFPPEATDRAVYLVRNPLDLAISFAHHAVIDIDDSIDCLSNEQYALGADTDRLPQHLQQRLLSWSLHVRSWLDETPFPVLLMRYEDMHSNPIETFGSCAEFLDIKASPDELRTALRYSTFEEMTAQEQASGFRERPTRAEAFFRKGAVGEWRNRLMPRQVEKVLERQHDVMARLGYISIDGSIS